MPSRLVSGGKVGIVGGGPAGSFFALYLLYYARRQGIDLEVDIYEQKSFARGGPAGCNRCAGILSASLLSNLREISIYLPETVIRSRISSYRLHSPYGVMVVHNPHIGEDIFSVYRGGGPRLFPLGESISFDGFLLGQARHRGARVIEKRVTALKLKPTPSIEVEGRDYSYDLVVLASGVNSAPLASYGSDYDSPAIHYMAQDELLFDAEEVRARLGSAVQVFFLPGTDLIFGTLVPKGEFVNVSLLGRKGSRFTVDEFLDHPLVRGVLPLPYRKTCGCRPRIAIGPAAHPYGDGFVAVGDAAVTRLYKDGIGSALLTARQAARAAVLYGLSARDFHRHYRPLVQAINRDNGLGRFLFTINDWMKNSPSLFRAHSKLARSEWSRPGSGRPFNKVIWGMFTGSYTYRQIMRTVLHPGSVFRLVLAFSRERTGELLGIAPETSSLGTDRPKPINILVLGGGFAGVYSVLRLEKAFRNDDSVSITLVSNENFFLFTPLLHEVATGGVETRHISYPLRSLRGKKKFRIIHAEVESIDLGGKRVVTEQGVVPYDYLILALGSTTRGTPQALDGVFTLKSLRDGILVRNHIIRMFEQADAEVSQEQQGRLLTFVVAGGGYTGVQLVADIRDFISSSLLKKYRRLYPHLVRVILVQHEQRILSEMDRHLADFALRFLRERGVEVMLNSRVTGAKTGEVVINYNQSIAANTLVWVGGVIANPVIAAVSAPKDDRGRVLVNQQLQVPGFPGVYAMGDNASFEDRHSGTSLPPRAHIAVRQPKTAAANIIAEIKGRPLKPYRYSDWGQMVSLGSRCAVMSFRGVRLYGFPARVVWLVAYLSLMKGVYNRIRVATDWLLSLIFGRDITLLNVK